MTPTTQPIRHRRTNGYEKNYKFMRLILTLLLATSGVLLLAAGIIAGLP